jgi:cytochrome c peroxidase
MVEIRDAYTGVVATSLNDAGTSPRATLLDPHNHLFVQAALGRNVTVFDLEPLVTAGDSGTPTKLADISTVAQDTTDPTLLMGKRIFNSAADSRMTPQGYLTCAACHFDGFEDGRVFDFTSRGEGLRNTTSLLGRRGTGMGPVHWSGNFDEIQDFEQEIRELFSGHGFMADDVLAVGSRQQALGDVKAGLSPELDALAAYVTSLDHVNLSPFRNPDGTLTDGALAGKALFGKLGCEFCHAGRDFTDSARGRLHDVGTLQPSSGSRSGKALLGIDTPTLLGVWETAPYLHDGSAATLRDVLVGKNPNDQHGFVSALTPAEVDQLVDFLQQLDDEQPQHRLPFEPPLPEMIGGTGGGGASSAGRRGAGDRGRGRFPRLCCAHDRICGAGLRVGGPGADWPRARKLAAIRLVPGRFRCG